MAKKYYIKTMGCQMNVHDSEKIAGIFSESGYDQSVDSKSADVVVLNTCSIRDKAEHKFYSELGRLKKIKKINPDLQIAVAGCIAQQEGEVIFRRFPYVDFIFGPDNIDNLQNWINNVPCDTGKITHHGSRITVTGNNPEYHVKILPVKRAGRVRAWVSIMYGCDNFCAYCVVPYTRGRERSRPSGDIYREISSLALKGFKEITLLGQNVNSYGKGIDGQINFPKLLKLIHEIEGIERIRFITSHPKDLSEELISSMAELPKVCEHIHLPLQAGSDSVLSRMNRRYDYKDFREKIEMIRDTIPGIAVTSDIVTGFPGETDEDFKYTVDALKEIGFDGIFAFKYSKRPNTKALTLSGHIDEEIKSDRLSKVLEMQESITYRRNKTLEGEVLEVLIEGVSETDKKRLTGRTRTNKIVNFHGNAADIGRLVNIKILEAMQHSLNGIKAE